MSKKRRQSETPEEYFARMEERQRHQYDPGFYVGRPHPIYTDNQRPRWFGTSLLIMGSMGMIGMVYNLVTAESLWQNLSSALPIAGLSGLMILAGLRFVRKDSN